MADTVSLTVDALPQDLVDRLQRRASQKGHSVQAEVRDILTSALPPTQPYATGADLLAAIRELFEPIGGVELEIPKREPMRPPPTFR